MSVERTLSIIKPDAVAKNVVGQIIARVEKNDLKVVAGKMMHLSREQAESRKGYRVKTCSNSKRKSFE